LQENSASFWTESKKLSKNGAIRLWIEPSNGEIRGFFAALRMTIHKFSRQIEALERF